MATADDNPTPMDLRSGQPTGTQRSDPTVPFALRTRSFRFTHWDDGRLTVNQDFAATLSTHKLTTFAAMQNLTGGQIAKHLIHGRTTTRYVLRDGDGEHVFYLKRQRPTPLKDHVKTLSRLTLPVIGLTGEWKAMIRFHQLGIPTMVPVALGRCGRYSFVLTEGLEGFEKLSDWMRQRLVHPRPQDLAATARMARGIALLARVMHAAGMHHQDFYLGHLLRPTTGPGDHIHVIDLGRVRRRVRLSQRWVVKDLAQLNYSAHLVRRTDRIRFLQTYLGRPLQGHDKNLINKVQRKSLAIERHSVKHAL